MVWPALGITTSPAVGIVRFMSSPGSRHGQSSSPVMTRGWGRDRLHLVDEIEQGRPPFLHPAQSARRTFARVLGELFDEFLPAARVFVLELHAGWPERIGLGCLWHAGLFELPCRRLRFLCELLPLVGRGPIAAARHDQRP